MTIDPRWLHYGEVVLTGTFAAPLSLFKEARHFVEEHMGVLSRIITARCRLDEIHEAVARVKKGQALKTVLVFD